MVTKALREDASLPVDLDSLNFNPGRTSADFNHNLPFDSFVHGAVFLAEVVLQAPTWSSSAEVSEVSFKKGGSPRDIIQLDKRTERSQHNNSSNIKMNSAPDEKR